MPVSTARLAIYQCDDWSPSPVILGLVRLLQQIQLFQSKHQNPKQLIWCEPQKPKPRKEGE
jgi:hypothetical protein